jgi:hypothetical protein
MSSIPRLACQGADDHRHAQGASLFHTSRLPTLPTQSTVAYFPGCELRTTARGSSSEFVLKMMNAAKIRSVTVGKFDNVKDLERAVDGGAR